jgi:hypothetical protein
VPPAAVLCAAMTFVEHIGSQDRYHVPNRRLQRKRRAGEAGGRQLRAAAWQALYVSLVASALAAASVFLGHRYNVYGLFSLSALRSLKPAESDVGGVDESGNHSRSSVYRRHLTFEKFESIFLNRRIVSFASAHNASVRESIWRLLSEDYRHITVPVGRPAASAAEVVTIGGHPFSPLYEAELCEYLASSDVAPRGGAVPVHAAPLCVFDDQLLNRLPKIKHILDHPQILFTEADNEMKELFTDFDSPPIISIGTNGSGFAFHRHRRSYSDLYAGERLWSVYPPFNLPARGFNPWYAVEFTCLA